MYIAVYYAISDWEPWLSIDVDSYTYDWLNLFAALAQPKLSPSNITVMPKIRVIDADVYLLFWVEDKITPLP